MRRVLAVVLVIAGCQGVPTTSTISEELVVVSPATYDFGAYELGTMSAPKVISVNPGSGASFDVVNAVTEACPDFSVNAPGLPAEVYRVCDNGGPIPVKGEPASAICNTIEYQTYPFTAEFKPTVTGATSCVVTITLNNATTRTVTLSGTGTSPPVRIDVTPPSVQFGDVRRNTTSGGAQILVRNLGSQNMTVSSATASTGFMITAGPPSTTVGPSGMQPYTVVCMPTAVGQMNGSFVVQANDPLKPTTTIPLACRGIDSNLDIAPSPVTIPPTRVGEPVIADIDLVNVGAAPMMIETVVLTGAELELVTAPPAGTMLAGNGGKFTARVRYPATIAGAPAGSLDVTYDNNQTRSSQISARALETSMSLTPDGDVDLGPVCLGQTKRQPFKILANADASFVITAVTTPDAPYTLTTPTLPATVIGAGGNELALEVAAAPTLAGLATSTIAITTDIPNATTREIRLSSTGVAEGVSATPEILDLGSQPKDTTTIGQEIAISNCTTAPANFGTARIEGPDAASFAIVQQPMSTALAPNDVARWLVVLSPRTTGVKTATFLVDTDGGTVSVALVGEGLGALIGNGPKGYYACAAGGDGATPLAIALVLVVVWAPRRRRARR